MKFEGQFNPEEAQIMLCAFSIDGFDGNKLCHQTGFIFKCFSGCLTLKCNLMMKQIKNHQRALYIAKLKGRIHKPKPFCFI